MRDSEALLRMIFQAARAAGVSRDALAAELNCPPAFLDNPEGRHPHELQAYFWAALEKLTGDVEIGLSLCRHLPGFDGHRLEYVLLSSSTLREGLMFAHRYRRVLSDAMALRLVDGSGGEHLEIQAAVYEGPQRRHTDICVVYAVLRALRIVPLAAPPSRVHLAFEARLSPAVYETLFGCPVVFAAPINRIEIPPGMLDAPLPLADPDIADLHRRMVASKIAPIERQDIVDHIRSALYARSLTHEGVSATLSDLAVVLGVPERRIRDALGDSGTSFRNLLTEIRACVAEHLLRDTNAPLDYVARAAGFMDRTALSRSFGATRGLPPLRYRRQAQARARRAGARTRLRDPEDVLQELKRNADRRLITDRIEQP